MAGCHLINDVLLQLLSGPFGRVTIRLDNRKVAL